MKFLVVLGTRPNFIKHVAFQESCRRFGIECITAHTGQHGSEEMSGVFFRTLGLAPPDYVNKMRRGTPAEELEQMMTFIGRTIDEVRPAVTVVYGDVTSTMAGALASARVGVPVAHIEAGVHTDFWGNPEEQNRRITEASADMLFAHTEDAYRTLVESGYPESDVVLAGDIVKDSLLIVADRHGIKPSAGDYVALTVHRAENIEHPGRLRAICGAMMESGKNIRFPVHPRTREALGENGLWERLAASPNIELLPPLGYMDSLKLIAGCERVASDSGGVRREAYIFGKPVVSLIEMVWVPSMVEAGWEYIAGADSAKILHGLDGFTPPTGRPGIFGDGKAAERMVRCLLERHGGKRTDRVKIDEPVRVSMVVPCYNEEDSLPTLFGRLADLRSRIDAARYRFEYILVDDGSTDRTWDMLGKEFGTDRSVRLIRKRKNEGIGAALKAGFRAATGDIVVTVDADTNYDLRETPELLKHLSKDVDLVTASPFMAGGAWNYPVYRYLLSRSVTLLYRLLLGGTGRDIGTFTCGFRVYRSHAIRRIFPQADGFTATAEMLVRSLAIGLSVIQVPATVRDRRHGYSKMRYGRTILGHLGLMWKLLHRGTGSLMLSDFHG